MRHSLIVAVWIATWGVTLAAEKIEYSRDVLPILQRHCMGCHTADEAQGGMVMESHAALMKGGESGPAITPGVASSSRMILMARGQMEPIMPPEGEERLSEKELEVLALWVEQGAVGSEDGPPLKRDLRTPTIPTGENVTLPITAIAMSPQGEYRAIARYGEIEVKRQDGTTAAKLASGLHKVNSIRFSKDGSRLLVASGATGAYGTAAIFSIETGQRLTEMVGHRDILYAAIFSPDESKVATAGYDRQIILWDAESGEPIREFQGHNGAIFDLAFSPDGKVLVSGCADETAKVWQVDTGKRLDTLSQPEGEVLAVDITSDGRFILAGSADNRLRVWALRSQERPRINPIVATRFVDESPLVNFHLSDDGRLLVVLSEAGNVKVIRTSDWNQAATLEPLPDTGSDLCIGRDGKTVLISLMNGEVVRRELPALQAEQAAQSDSVTPVYMDLGPLTALEETSLREKRKENPSLAGSIGSAATPIRVGRGVEVRGVIREPGEADRYQWPARAGEVWAIDADAVDKSPIDPIVTVFSGDNEPVLRTRLQAVRDSYFTFRGKDSKQISDFRLFNWQEMHLNDYLYAAGEVTRLWMYPRGPDSGYNVYPNEGLRWTYFGTSHTTHALGEPAYIVRPVDSGQSPIANGLPVFDIFYENDDDPMRMAGKNSRLLFTAPSDGPFTVRITDTRGDGGENFAYRLRIRPAEPGFAASVQKAKSPIHRGSGREFIVRVDRIDGFDGPVTFDIPQLPPGMIANVPLVIERGQRYAVGTLWASEHAEGWEGEIAPQIVARAQVAGRMVERRVGTVGELALGDRPNVIASIQPIDGTVPEGENWTLTVRRGETVSARVIVRRQEGFANEISFGKENAGRNATHGVYVDNIGLNGLLVRRNEDEREFFVTADPIAVPGKRSFFLSGNVNGTITTHPITLEVLP